MSWKVKNNIPIERMGKAWQGFLLNIETILTMCDMRGDNIYNVNQLLINQSNDTSNNIKDKRKRFMASVEIIGETIEVKDVLSIEDRLMFTIIKSKI